MFSSRNSFAAFLLRINNPESGINALRNKAKEISSTLGMENEFKKLNQLISALLPSENLRQAGLPAGARHQRKQAGLATGKSKNLTSPAAIARSLGEPLDPDRIKLFESLYEELAGKYFLNILIRTHLSNPIRHSRFSKDTFRITSKGQNSP
jgi:hypothetical protein